jgi:Cdc6-like AAA superfamily ATPase
MLLTYNDPSEAFAALIEQQVIVEERHLALCLDRIDTIKEDVDTYIENSNNNVTFWKKLFRTKPLQKPDNYHGYVRLYYKFVDGWGLPHDSALEKLFTKSEALRRQVIVILDQMDNRGRNFSVTLDTDGWRMYVPESATL